MARTDSLTGLSNRRYFFETYNKLFSYSKRKKTPLSVIMADIDHFKKINDTKGHQVGDKVLQTLGERFSRLCRKEDISARYGGEEFVVSLLGTKLKDAVTFAERFKSNFSSDTENTFGFKVTLSFGAAQLTCENHPNELIKLADEKLYQAKNSGRDRICY
jgi:diguanylate cyclase (GGDEF)-like protein